jgi:hypothetical protein
MFGPAKEGSIGLGSAIFGPLEPERSSGVFGGPVPQGVNSVFCRVTFDGKRRDVKASSLSFLRVLCLDSQSLLNNSRSGAGRLGAVVEVSEWSNGF